MNCILHKITYPTFRILLLVKLSESIYLERDVFVSKNLSADTKPSSSSRAAKVSQQKIPLEQVKKKTFAVAYKSPIALKLAAQSGKCAELALQIAERFHQPSSLLWRNDSVTAAAILSEFVVKVTKQGWLEFALSDRGLATWLQCLLQNPLPTNHRQQIATVTLSEKDHSKLLISQYVHARCCSLLRLASDARLIRVKEPASPEQTSFCDSVVWLTGEGDFYLSHSTEQALIFETIATLDWFYEPCQPHDIHAHLKMMFRLSQAFQAFDRACRILGESPQRSQAKLGLVMTTQKLLRSLLQEIGVSAPSEL